MITSRLRSFVGLLSVVLLIAIVSTAPVAHSTVSTNAITIAAFSEDNQPISTIKSGANFYYRIQSTSDHIPYTVYFQFDPRLHWFTVGSDGQCDVPDSHGHMHCTYTQQTQGTSWIWFQAHQSFDRTIEAQIIQNNQTITHTLEFATYAIALPLVAK